MFFSPDFNVFIEGDLQEGDFQTPDQGVYDYPFLRTLFLISFSKCTYLSRFIPIQTGNLINLCFKITLYGNSSLDISRLSVQPHFVRNLSVCSVCETQHGISHIRPLCVLNISGVHSLSICIILFTEWNKPVCIKTQSGHHSQKKSIFPIQLLFSCCSARILPSSL